MTLCNDCGLPIVSGQTWESVDGGLFVHTREDCRASRIKRIEELEGGLNKIIEEGGSSFEPAAIMLVEIAEEALTGKVRIK